MGVRFLKIATYLRIRPAAVSATWSIPVTSKGRPWVLAAVVLRHQLCLGEDVAFHRSFKIPLRGARRKIEHDVERVQLEKVPMRARRRTGTSVPDPPKIRCPLLRPVRERCGLWQIFLEPARARWDIPQDPVDPCADRGIRIIRDERKTPGIRRDLRPRKRRGDIRSVTGVLGGDHPPWFESCTRQLHHRCEK